MILEVLKFLGAAIATKSLELYLAKNKRTEGDNTGSNQ